VSKKVGKAVVRNRVKRRFREAVRQELPSIRPGLDLVFIARPSAAEASYWQIAEAVHAALRRTGALARPAELSHA
jgi:ribonuclease P protein component